MKMDATAWRAEHTDGYTYKLQVNQIKHGDKSKLAELFKDWNVQAVGWNIKSGDQIKILIKTFQSEKDWILWAKSCPVKIVETKYRSGKEIKIQRSCKTRKKRGQNVLGS